MNVGGPLGPLQERVLALERALRGAGVPVAVSEGLDAMRAAVAVELVDREHLRHALDATLVKTDTHRAAFANLFDLYFPARFGLEPAAPTDAAGADPSATPDIAGLLAELVARVQAGDAGAIAGMAWEAVGAYGGVPDRDGEVSYFAYRVFRDINLAGLLRRLLGEAPPADGVLADRLRRDEFELALRRFREEVETEIRRRRAVQRGAEEVACRAVGPLPEDVDFFRVSAADEQAVMHRSAQLGRKLATRLAAKRRRAHDGRLDIRRTVRRSLSTGGAPMNPHVRARRASRPELVLLCDVSGSVAAFARFTLLFCHALQGQFSRVRSLAFIDTVEEVSGLFVDGDFSNSLQRLSEEANLVWFDGHSGYGHAFKTFHTKYPDAITPRTTVLVLGGARSNYRAANTWVLADLRRLAKRLYWLNPEPAAQWGSGDSIALDYPGDRPDGGVQKPAPTQRFRRGAGVDERAAPRLRW